MRATDLDRQIRNMTTQEIEDLMHIDRNPDRIENDLMYQDARREGDHATRGALNLGASGGYPGCSPYETDVPRRTWLLVAFMAVVVFGAIKVLGL